MKTWKHGIFGILAVITLTLAFTACDDGNGKDNGKKEPCPCTDKVHYDTPCDCVGVGNDCDCTVYYKPALTDVFRFRETIPTEAQDKISTTFNAALNAIWATDPQLLLDLEAKTDTIQIRYTVNGDPIILDYYAGGMIAVTGDLNNFPADFPDQLKAKLTEARDDATFL